MTGVSCTRCLLSEAHPGISIDSSGLCNLCLEVAPAVPGLEALRALLTRRGTGDYDCVVCWSGGKDSTFMLDVLRRELDLRLLAYTFDNTFLAPEAHDNLARLAETLGVEHRMVVPEHGAYRQVIKAGFVGLDSVPTDGLYHQALRRHGPACYPCGVAFHSAAIRLADEVGAPYIATGFTRGQDRAFYADYRGDGATDASAPSSARLHSAAAWPRIGNMLGRLIKQSGGPDMGLYLDTADAESSQAIEFFRLFDFMAYDPADVYARVEALGWERPVTTDSCSTNCSLNAVGIDRYQKRFGVHLYAPEVSDLVRRGVISRDAGAEILNTPLDRERVRSIEELLDLPSSSDDDHEN